MAWVVDAENDWMKRANCLGVDPDLFFPEKGGATTEAKQVCETCEVKTECLDYGLQYSMGHGVWGGASDRERRRIKRRMNEAGRELRTAG